MTGLSQVSGHLGVPPPRKLYLNDKFTIEHALEESPLLQPPRQHRTSKDLDIIRRIPNYFYQFEHILGKSITPSIDRILKKPYTIKDYII